LFFPIPQKSAKLQHLLQPIGHGFPSLSRAKEAQKLGSHWKPYLVITDIRQKIHLEKVRL
jgi:hypothetical protein